MPTYCEAAAGHPIHGPYHDEEYGFPVHEDDRLFERLVLEINQAGLAWLTILKKRDGFRRAYDDFDVEAVAAYGDAERERLLADPGIVRNRLKVAAAIENAARILQLRRSYGSFADWLDAHHPLPLESWRALFKQTFVFTGGEIVREFLVSTGFLPGAHAEGCPVRERILELSPPWARTGGPANPLAGAVSKRRSRARDGRRADFRTERTGSAAAAVETFIERHPPALRELIRELRALVMGSLTPAAERLNAGWGGLAYHDAQAGYVCGIFPREREHVVRLLFEHGAALGDPDGILTGSGSQTRYVVLRPGSTVPEAAIRDMVDRAVLHRAIR